MEAQRVVVTGENRAIEPGSISGQPAVAFDATGAGDLLVFLHGVGADRRVWRRQLEHFGASFRAVAWDAPGYGDSGDFAGSGGSRRAVTISAFSEALLRLIDYFGAERAHLVGHSMGGVIAQDFYSRHPARVRSLTLANTTRSLRLSMTEAELEAFLEARKTPLEQGASLAELARALAGNLLAEEHDPAVHAQVVACLSALRPQSYIEALEAVTRYRQRIDLGAVTVPTLIVTSDRDRLTPPTEGAEIAARIPRAKHATLAGAGHMSNMEAPDEFNHILGEFLRTVD